MKFLKKLLRGIATFLYSRDPYIKGMAGQVDIRTWQKYQTYKESRPAHPMRGRFGDPPPEWDGAKAIIRRELKELDEIFIYVAEYRDDWSVPAIGEDGKLRGDCDAYAAHIKERLLSHGFHDDWLRLAMVKRNRYAAKNYDHMVLVVRFADGDRVIDNNHRGDAWDWRSLDVTWHAWEDGRGGLELIDNEV